MGRSLATRLRGPQFRLEALEDRVTPAGDFLRTLADPAPALADQFGVSVAIDDRYVIVGAPFDDPGGVTDAGSAYVFNRETGELVLAIPNPEPGPGDRFGTSVIISGGAGWIGAPFDDPGGLTDAGSVYSFGVPERDGPERCAPPPVPGRGRSSSVSPWRRTAVATSSRLVLRRKLRRPAGRT